MRTAGPVRLIDTHCHLNDVRQYPNPEPYIREAQATGVERLVVIGVDTESSLRAVALAEEHGCVYAAVGWHPNYASNYDRDGLLAVREMLAHPKVVALGEIGLDFYRDHASPEDQHRCLVDQLDVAEELGVPVVFHCRDAYPALFEVLEARARAPYLFHCFAGSAADAERARSLGAWFGVDGPITYRGSDGLRAVVRALPRDRVVIETDSPWMTPVPHRGQPNRPAWVSHVCEGLAQVWGVSAEDCGETTSQNAESFFAFDRG